MTREEAIRELKIQFVGEYDRQREAKDMAIQALEQEPKWIPVSEKYEYHIDHTDCIWYEAGGCPVTCSQYRDGWNDAMDYIFKNGDGYRPYRRNLPDINIGNMSEIPTGSKDVIWYNKKNYSEIISEPQESEEV